MSRAKLARVSMLIVSMLTVLGILLGSTSIFVEIERDILADVPARVLGVRAGPIESVDQSPSLTPPPLPSPTPQFSATPPPTSRSTPTPQATVSATSTPAVTPAPSQGPDLPLDYRVEVLAQTGGTSKAIAADDRYLYVGHGPRVLIRDLGLPFDDGAARHARTEILPGVVDALAVVRGRLFVGVSWLEGDDLRGGLLVFSLTDPLRPQLVSFVDTGTVYQEFLFQEERSLLWASGGRPVGEPDLEWQRYRTGVEAWDLFASDPPVLRSWTYFDFPEYYFSAGPRISLAEMAGRLFVSYVGSGESVISVLATDDPGAPVELGFWKTDGRILLIRGHWNKLYVLVNRDLGREPWGVQLQVLSFDDPARPRLLGHLDSHALIGCGLERGAIVPELRALFVLNPCDRSLTVFDLTNEAAPRQYARHGLPWPARDLVLGRHGIDFALDTQGGVGRLRLSPGSFDEIAGAWALDRIGLTDMLVADQDAVWFVEPPGTLARLPLNALDAMVPAERLVRNDLDRIQQLYDLGDWLATLGSGLKAIDRNTLEAGPRYTGRLDSPDFEAGRNRVYASGTNAGIRNLAVQGGQFVEVAKNEDFVRGSLHFEGQFLYVQGRRRDDSSKSLHRVDRDSLTHVPRGAWMDAYEALSSRAPRIGGGRLVFGGEYLISAGIHRLSNDPDEHLALLFDRLDLDPRGVGGGRIEIFHAEPYIGATHLGLSAYDGGFVLASERGFLLAPTRVVAGTQRQPLALWTAPSKLAGLAPIGEGSKMPESFVASAGEAGLYHLRLVSNRLPRPTPSATPTRIPTHSPTPTLPPSSTPVLRRDRALFLPIIGRDMVDRQHWGAPLPSLAVEAYHGGINGVMRVEGRRVYHDETGQLAILEMGADGELREIGRGPDLGRVYRDLLVDGDFAYVALDDLGVAILEIADPANIQVVTRIATIRPTLGLARHAGWLYLAQDKSIERVDVTNPWQPSRPALFVDGSYGISALKVRDDHLYGLPIDQSIEHLRVFDLLADDREGTMPLQPIEGFEEHPWWERTTISEIYFADDGRVVAMGPDLVVLYVLEMDSPMEIRLLGRLIMQDLTEGGASYLAGNWLIRVRFSSVSPGEHSLSLYALDALYAKVERSEQIGDPSRTIVLGQEVAGKVTGAGQIGDQLVVQMGDGIFGGFVQVDLSENTDQPRLLAGVRWDYSDAHRVGNWIVRFQWTQYFPKSPWLTLWPIDLDRTTTHPIELRLEDGEWALWADERYIYTFAPGGPHGTIRAYDGAVLPELRLAGRFERRAGSSRTFLASNSRRLYIMQTYMFGLDDDLVRVEALSLDSTSFFQSLGAFDDARTFERSRYDRPFFVDAQDRMLTTRRGGELAIFDARDPTAIRVLSGLYRPMACDKNAFLVDGDTLFCIGNDLDRLQLIDISDPAAARLRYELPFPELGGRDMRVGEYALAIDGPYLLLANGKIQILDLPKLRRGKLSLLGELQGSQAGDREAPWYFGGLIPWNGQLFAQSRRSVGSGRFIQQGLARIVWSRP